ncbi:hypothetical protein TNCT_402161 [Trichonephila clavata]|uniref:Uncharacterized protein n=1 Tax=Trichonephila clavata TaxID=2740835 RepID=A0A8X6HZ11_TRICU|nr:hypothetical protein TNCT_402161 [Trichonephila clavata]
MIGLTPQKTPDKAITADRTSSVERERDRKKRTIRPIIEKKMNGLFAYFDHNQLKGVTVPGITGSDSLLLRVGKCSEC